MSASKVYFTNFRATFTENLLQKLARLVKKAGMLEQIDFKNQYTAIKIHFGEPGNLAYLRPNYSKVIVDLIKEQGGKVFLTDCNTLYVGGRKNALDHLDLRLHKRLQSLYHRLPSADRRWTEGYRRYPRPD